MHSRGADVSRNEHTLHFTMLHLAEIKLKKYVQNLYSDDNKKNPNDLLHRKNRYIKI